MNLIKKLASKPIIGPIIKRLIRFEANRQAVTIANHFSDFLTPVVAKNDELRNKAYEIRHNVYCEELNFEPLKDDKLEVDDFDAHSFHCLIRHISTGRYAGTVRIVYSRADSQLLPIEKYCLDSIDHETLNPKNFPRNSICEISRLAVPQEFRRRQTDRHKGAATGVINEETYSERELRCFPFIAVGLYMTAANIVANKDIKHCFVMMEPRLARSMKFVGIEFQQIGPVVDYHGKRAPYYITPEMLFKTLSPGFMALYKNIQKQLSDKRQNNIDDGSGEFEPSAFVVSM